MERPLLRALTKLEKLLKQNFGHWPFYALNLTFVSPPYSYPLNQSQVSGSKITSYTPNQPQNTDSATISYPPSNSQVTNSPLVSHSLNKPQVTYSETTSYPQNQPQVTDSAIISYPVNKPGVTGSSTTNYTLNQPQVNFQETTSYLQSKPQVIGSKTTNYCPNQPQVNGSATISFPQNHQGALPNHPQFTSYLSNYPQAIKCKENKYPELTSRLATNVPGSIPSTGRAVFKSIISESNRSVPDTQVSKLLGCPNCKSFMSLVNLKSHLLKCSQSIKGGNNNNIGDQGSIPSEEQSSVSNKYGPKKARRARTQFSTEQKAILNAAVLNKTTRKISLAMVNDVVRKTGLSVEVVKVSNIHSTKV